MKEVIPVTSKIAKLLAVLLVLLMVLPACAEEEPDRFFVTIDTTSEGREISPWIYGINILGNENNLGRVTVNAARQGGNRMTAYNWETNASNAGSDWKHSSDTYLSKSSRPADLALLLSEQTVAADIPFRITTLQMAGYVSADTRGVVPETQTAPSERWNQVYASGSGQYGETPDLTDGAVYMDEYVRYITEKLGGAVSPTGIQGYSLDNEPAIWNYTHPRVHPEPVSVQELTEKSVALATVVKTIDPDAMIFGPAVYGYTAYDHLSDDDTSIEWERLKDKNQYYWYLDCYLDQMKQAGDAAGMRLLDVLDIHYYSESARLGPEDRVQSVRTLYEKGFAENSWIGKWCQSSIPILPTVQRSIDTWYPGTLLAISEYNFGGDNDASGAVAQAEALGCFAEQGVFFAALWAGGDYTFAGINLYTNYDGQGGCFGDRLIPALSEDVSRVSAYAAVYSDDPSAVSVVLTNKSLTDPVIADVSLWEPYQETGSEEIWGVWGDSARISPIEDALSFEDGRIIVTLPPLCAAVMILKTEQ